MQFQCNISSLFLVLLSPSSMHLLLSGFTLPLLVSMMMTTTHLLLFFLCYKDVLLVNIEIYVSTLKLSCLYDKFALKLVSFNYFKIFNLYLNIGYFSIKSKFDKKKPTVRIILLIKTATRHEEKEKFRRRDMVKKRNLC